MTAKRPAELDDRERQGTSYIRYGDGTVHMRRGAAWCSECGDMPEMMGTLADGITPVYYPCKTKLLHPGGGPFAPGYRGPVAGYTGPEVAAGREVDAMRAAMCAANAATKSKRRWTEHFSSREWCILFAGYLVGLIVAGVLHR